VESFITAWYDTLRELGEKSGEQAKSLTSQLKRAAAGKLRGLAGNPMLLTIMALVQTNHGTLPEQRVKLYKACIEILLLRWQRTKEEAGSDLPQTLAEAGLSQGLLNPLLYEIGWVAHQEQAERQEAADISELRVLELALKHLKARQKAAIFVDYTEERAHLLIGRGGATDRRFSFIHRTFQVHFKIIG
jgi:predicted NACHT family NTPase